MEKLRFEITAKAKKGDERTTILCLTSIATVEGETFMLPEDLQDATLHSELIKTETFKKVKNSITKRHQKRNVWIKLNDNLRETYVDNEGNIQFSNYILEERSDNTQSTGNANISKIQSIEKNFRKLAEKFVLEKFNRKNINVNQWMELFESECERLNLQIDEEKIQVFRLFLEGSCIDWYGSMLIKLTINSNWAEWKKNFCETYIDKGWSTTKYAISFKYMSGPLLDYALKKEKILLEMDKSISTKMLNNLIAAGLPDFITDRIDKAKVKETRDIFNELGKLEHLVNKKVPENKKIGKTGQNQKAEEKIPCSICKEKRNKNLYHSEASCWLKSNETSLNKNKQIKHVNNSVIEAELNDVETKNE